MKNKTTEELESGTRSYQRTSTNVYNISNLAKEFSGETYKSEIGNKIIGRNAPLSYTPFTLGDISKEILIYVGPSTSSNFVDLTRIKIEIMDLSHASTYGSSKIMTGYVVDHDIDTNLNTFTEYLADTPIPRARPLFNITPDETILNEPVNYPLVWQTYDGDGCNGYGCITDYNGYFWYASILGSLLSSIKLSMCKIVAHHDTSIDLFSGDAID